jgi:hypothetical protein
MFDRHAFGDLALAVVLALPLVALAQTSPNSTMRTYDKSALTSAAADRLPGNGRISLLG